jgi:glycosidase
VSRSVRPVVAGVGVALSLAGSGSASNTVLLATPAPPRGSELRTLAQPSTRPPLASQRIYFVMPDRYANGNPANDTGGRTGPRSVTGYDPTDTGYYHGGDFAGLTGDCTGPRGLARIKNLGFNSIWVTPPYWQKYVQADSAAYHGYWAVKFNSVDPHLGTDADFAAFVDCAHRLGMKVILDVVVNHTADVIQLSSNQYGEPKTPFVPEVERSLKNPEWLNDTANYHNRGNIDFANCTTTCLELGDFFGLDDLATERPNVREGLANVFASWIQRYRIDGFRIDTAKHVEAGFFADWVPRIMTAARSAGVLDFQLFGEVFERNAIELSTYVRDRGLPNVIDFPMQDALVRFAGGSAGARGIATRLNDDDYFIAPDGARHVPPTFLGNHDVGRAALQVRDTGGGSSRLLDRTLLAYSLLYLLRGAPVVYYGDEHGIIGRGGDKEARHDLFATQVAAWKAEERLVGGPIGDGSSFDRDDNRIADRLRGLAQMRTEHPALSTGATIVRRADRNVLVVSRIDASSRREYIAAFNAGTGTASIEVPAATPGGWRPLFGALQSPEPLVQVRNGRVVFRVPSVSSALLVAERTIPARRPVKPRLVVARDSLSDLVRASATAGTAPVSVAFAVKRGAGRWQRLAADDSPPYRTFLDPTDYRRRERVYVVAIARGLDGRTAVSAVRSFVPRR